MFLGAWLAAPEHPATWLIAGGVAFAAAFGLIFYALIPRLTRASQRRARRLVRPPGRASWSNRDRAAA